MSPQAYVWVKAIHQFGFLLWVGSMFALTLVLSAHARAAGARDAFVVAERAIGRAMELGALLTIAGGIAMIFGSSAVISPMKQPYVHIKLTLVVVLIAMHGVVRSKMARLGRGQGTAPPAWVSAVILILAMAIIWLAVVKPMLRV
ncbi:MAG TPA: CopD family protein [Kofleriaceae bacterium]|nr:CopD family protein [Kofleriaceae bacterium]